MRNKPARFEEVKESLKLVSRSRVSFSKKNQLMSDCQTTSQIFVLRHKASQHYKEFTEHYEVREEAFVQKKHKPGESRNSIRVSFCFTQRSTKVKMVLQQPIRVRDLAKFLTSPGYVLLFSQTDVVTPCVSPQNLTCSLTI